MDSGSEARRDSDALVVTVVSCFNPSDEFPEKVRRWMRFDMPLVIVDDGSEDKCLGILTEIESTGAVLVRGTCNGGIAHALNLGIEEARRRYGPSWVLILDQDSEIDVDYASQAFSELERAACSGSVALVCAGAINGVSVSCSVRRGAVMEPFDPIQSGSMIRMAAFDEIGLLREDLFIDWVDTEFNARLRSNGYSLMAARGCNLVHVVGQPRSLFLFGREVRLKAKTVLLDYHAPFRVYYMMRNSLVVSKQYMNGQSDWIFRRLLGDFERHLLRIVFGPNRFKVVIAIVWGCLDALRGRMGRINPSFARFLSDL